MTQPLVVIGAGGHGKVVADILLASGLTVDGFLDDGRPVGESVLGLPVLGPLDWLREHPASVALGVGHNDARARVAEQARQYGAELVTAVHPRAVVSPFSVLDEGVVVMALAVVQPHASVGRGAILNTACVVEHDCRVGAFAHVSPNAAMAGGCQLGDRAHLGIGAAMLPGTSVGFGSIVGGGAVVCRSIPEGVVAVGVPARVTR